MIGNSGPFNSIIALFIPQPASAAITCSTVDTLTPSSFSKRVQSSVWTENCQLAHIKSFPAATSVRRNHIPVSAEAGRTQSFTSVPVCKPVPINTTFDFNVFCKAPSIYTKININTLKTIVCLSHRHNSLFATI